MRSLVRRLVKLETNESNLRGREAAKLLDFPEKRDARIAYLLQRLTEPSFAETGRLAKVELIYLLRAKDAEEVANPFQWVIN